ncbi:MAG: hypothetical protein D6805_04505 [Planctomycetota bacterium]|nr:MAG: hypothetical protein D6805_04505 [Planctomycetota bacterium]
MNKIVFTIGLASFLPLFLSPLTAQQKQALYKYLIEDDGDYRYFPREKLFLNLRKYLHQYEQKGEPLRVKIVDELVRLWKNQENEAMDEGWVRFDTKYFRCIIQNSTSGEDENTGWPTGYNLLDQISKYMERHKKILSQISKLKKQLLQGKGDKDAIRAKIQELGKILKQNTWKHYGMITIYGVVKRSTAWGKVGGGEDSGVKPEVIVIEVVDVRVPRKRFFKQYGLKYYHQYEQYLKNHFSKKK